jgi:hypothetical protein
MIFVEHAGSIIDMNLLKNLFFIVLCLILVLFGWSSIDFPKEFYLINLWYWFQYKVI